jgi:hypothetical protein
MGGEMPQETVGWDLKNLMVEPSTSFKLYVLFLLIVSVVAATHLIKVLRVYPFLRVSRQADSSSAMVKLLSSSASLRFWMGCTWLAWGILMSTNVHTLCDHMLDETHLGVGVFLIVIRDYSAILTMTLVVFSVLFLVRWRALKGIERLRA